MEAKDLVSLSKARERLLPCGRCGCFRWFSNYNAERIATDWRRQRYGHWHEQPGRKRTSRIQGKHPRDSRLPTPAKSRLTSTGAAKGGQLMELEHTCNQVNAYFVVRWDIWPWIVRIAGCVMTLESTSNGRSAASWDPKPVPKMSGDVLRDLVAAAHQVDRDNGYGFHGRLFFCNDLMWLWWLLELYRRT